MLIVFVKAPRPGFVKTRLAQEIGTLAAAQVYETIASELFHSLRGLSGVELRYAPLDARGEIAPWLRKDWLATSQGEGDLGTRLTTAFAEKFRSGAERVIVIGSDCPYITAEDIRSACQALDRVDVVLGPALDGGYWLIALTREHRQLFENISWSTGAVLRETVSRAKELELRVHFLRELEDIDTAESWNRLLISRAGKTGN